MPFAHCALSELGGASKRRPFSLDVLISDVRYLMRQPAQKAEVGASFGFAHAHSMSFLLLLRRPFDGYAVEFTFQDAGHGLSIGRDRHP